jgi:hypothetical protein
MKQYNGEKAIISLTSWKARINFVAKTLFSLIKQCPGFHIVLVLSEEEFPQKEAELPKNLKVLADMDLIEIMWIYKNYKSFKKILFTMNKYQTIPIISADDDVIYKVNFADALYNKWVASRNSIVTTELYSGYGLHWGVGGSGILFPPNCFPKAIKCLATPIISTNHDDALYGCLAGFYNVPWIECNVYKRTDVLFDLDGTRSVGMGVNGLYTDRDIPRIKLLIQKILEF